MALRTDRFEIKNGPSKWDMVLAIFDGDELHRRTVNFVVSGPPIVLGDLVLPSLPFVVDGAKRDHLSEDDWQIWGYPFCGYKHNRYMKGFYSTQSRTGWLEF